MGIQIPRRDLNGDSRERKYKKEELTDEELCGIPQWEIEYYEMMDNRYRIR